MPRLKLPWDISTGPTPEQLLYEDEPGVFMQGLHYAAEGLGLPQRGVLSAATGFQEDVRSFDQLLEYYGVPEGPELDEVEGRLGKAAVWGLAGAAAAAPFTGGLSLLGGLIFAGISQVGGPAKNVRELLGGAGEIATDPLMYLRIGRHGAEATKQFLGHYWTKSGKNLRLQKVQEIFPVLKKSGMETDKAAQAAFEQAERFLVEKAGGTTAKAIKRGWLHPGGVRLAGVGLVPQSALDSISKAIRTRLPDPIKRAIGKAGPEGRDVIVTQRQTSRHMNKLGEDYAKRLGQVIEKQKLPSEYVLRLHDVVSMEKIYGIDGAISKAIPDVKPKHVRGIKRAVAKIRGEYKRALKYARKEGLDIDELDEAIGRDIAKKQVQLSVLKRKYLKKMTRDPQKTIDRVQKKIEELDGLRRAIASKARPELEKSLRPLMQSIEEIERQGFAKGLKRVQIDVEIQDFIREQGPKVAESLQAAHAGAARKLRGYDSAISRLIGAKEGLGQDLATRIAGADTVDDLMAKLSSEVRALDVAKKQTAGYAPQLYGADMQYVATWLASSPDRYDAWVKDLPKYVKGTESVVAGEAIVDMSRAEIARALMDNAIDKFTPGGLKALTGRTKTPHEAQRSLAVEIQASTRTNIERAEAELAKLREITRAPGSISPKITLRAMQMREKALTKQLTALRKEPQQWGTGTFRGLRSDEMRETVKGLEHLMGERLPRFRLQKMFGGKDGLGRLLGKMQPASVWQSEPMQALKDYWESTGKTIGTHKALEDAATRFGQVLKDFDPGDLKAFGGVPPGWMVLDDIPFFAGKAGGRKAPKAAIAMPTEIAYDMRRWWRNVNSSDTYRRFLMPYVYLSQYWKQMALAFPSFHSRNAQTGVWMATITGGMQNPMSFVHGARALIARGDFGLWGRKGGLAAERTRLQAKGFTSPWTGERWTYGEALDLSKKMGNEGPGLWQAGTTPDLPQFKGPVSLTKFDKALFNLSQKAGAGVENWLRHSQFFDLLQSGWSPREAAKEVARTHFLYETLTPIEKDIRTYLAPFFAWSRFVIPRTLQSMVSNPAPYLLFGKSMDDIEDEGEMPSHEALVPDWIRRQMGIHAGQTDEGEDIYGVLAGNWPASDVIQLMGDPVGELLSSLNPFPRMAIEAKFGEQLWSGKSISRFEGERVPFQFPWGQMGIPAEMEPLLRAFRWLNEYDRRYGPVARGEVDDPVSYARQQMLHSILGWKVYVIDREKVARGVLYRNESEYRKRKGLYFRAMHDEDHVNAETHLRWFAERGLPMPTETEVLRSWKRRQREAQRIQTRVSEVVGAQ